MRDIAARPPESKGLADAGFRRHVRRLHALGPRPVGEYLLELLNAYPQVAPFAHQRLAHYAEMDPALVRWAGGSDWIEPRQIMRLVAGERA